MKKYILILIAVGLIVYGRGLFNNFIGDDIEQIVNNPLVHSITNLPTFLQNGIYYDETNLRNMFYRPIMSATFTVIYSLSGENTFGYHLVQILLHVVNTILLYIIFKYFFKDEVPFLMALIYLVHPINVETVVYITALDNNLFMFFGLLAFYMTLKTKRGISDFLIPLFLLLSLLSKETGLVFLIIIPFFTFLYRKENFIKNIYQSLAAIFFYLILRLGVGHVNLFVNTLPVVPIQSMSLAERAMSIPSIILYYLKTSFFPINLVAFQMWVVRNLNFADFYLPLILDAIFFALILFHGFLIFKENREQFKKYLLFTIWFLMGLVVYLQIIPLDQTVADHYFYFALAGLLGLIWVIIEFISTQYHFQIRKLMLFAIIIILLFSVRTIVRVGDWYNTASLISHDAKYNQNNFLIEVMSGEVASGEGRNRDAESHYISATRLLPNSMTFGALGDFYLKNKKYDQAVIAYNRALDFNKGLAANWSYVAVARYLAGDRAGALTAAQTAYQISPTQTFAAILKTIEAREPIIIY